MVVAPTQVFILSRTEKNTNFEAMQTSKVWIQVWYCSLDIEAIEFWPNFQNLKFQTCCREKRALTLNISLKFLNFTKLHQTFFFPLPSRHSIKIGYKQMLKNIETTIKKQHQKKKVTTFIDDFFKWPV